MQFYPKWLALAGCFFAAYLASAQEQPPNIIWLMAEDISTDLACYGTAGVQTPNLDRLAAEGTRYTNAFSTNPICSPNRSAMMVGVHQNKINAHQHRSNRSIPLAEPYRPITYWLRQAGYTCVLGHEKVMGKGRKTDVNFQHDQLGPYDGKTQFGLFDKYDEISAENQPFFSQIQLLVTHRGDWWEEISAQSADPVDTAEIVLPPYLADHPIVKEDWARYLDQMEYMDHEVGLILDELEAKGLADNTIIIFIGDNGRCNLRGKGYLHDSGLRIPLIVWGKGVPQGRVEDALVDVTDMSASVLKLAGAELPDYLTGTPFINTAHQEKEYIYAARDLWDEVMEKSRAITGKRYKYIRHDHPQIPFDARQAYLEFYRPALHVMRDLQKEGKLTPEQSFFLAPHKPEEELYDLQNDPHELENLADSEEHREILQELRATLADMEQEMQTDGPAELVWPVSVDVLAWVMQNRPDLYQQMLAGKEIGFSRMVNAYRDAMEE